MIRECACLNLRKATRTLTQFYDKMLRPAGIRSTQLPLLATVAAAPSLTLSRLAEIVVIDQTTLSRNLKPLKDKGLIEIRPGKDRRVREVRITKNGKAMIRRAKPLWDNAQAKIADNLGSKRLQE
ncbi:MAG: winged helix-turn-helix transcriptional regulator, partial [SAR324 cluster bacterium]|nr:winged helix-turn-helix transcriptional regulator [SAR324 cluster bacterium]